MKARKVIAYALTFLIALSLTLVALSSNRKVSALAYESAPQPFYNYSDNNNYIEITAYGSNEGYYWLDSQILDDLGQYSNNTNLSSAQGSPYWSYRDNGDFYDLSFIQCFTFDSNFFNRLYVCLLNPYLEGLEEFRISIYETQRTTSVNINNINNYEYGDIYTFDVPQNAPSSAYVLLDLNDNKYFDSTKKYFIIVSCPCSEISTDEISIKIGCDYQTKSQDYQDGYQVGLLGGESNVINHTSDYNLYTDSEYISYGQSEYVRGLNEGNQAFSNYTNVLQTAFNGLSNFLNVQIFPGITIALIIGLPILFGLLLIILKLIRG